jgi:uracil-DNA glycosylase
VRLYPLYHPAAALYTPSMLETLRADFRRIPELLALPAPTQAASAAGTGEQPEPGEPELVVPEPELVAEITSEPAAEAPEAVQLGLF